MAKAEWDYCLELKGVTPKTLPMSRLAQYLSYFASLMGEQSNPVFAGVVKGSALLRASDRSGIPALAKARMRMAAEDTEAEGHQAFKRIANLCAADGVRGRVVDRQKAEVIAFPSKLSEPSSAREYIVTDTAEVDGIVVGVEGIDDTAHIRLLDPSNSRTVSLQVRDMSLARNAARHFRSGVIRVRTRGTWRRNEQGVWQPHSLFAEAIEELDQADAAAVFRLLRALPGNGWADLSREEADALLHELRGDA